MRLIMLLLACSLLLSGCAELERPDPSGVVMCSAEVMVCPDGSFVGRDPAANCSFSPCAQSGYGDPALGWRVQNTS